MNGKPEADEYNGYKCYANSKLFQVRQSKKCIKPTTFEYTLSPHIKLFPSARESIYSENRDNNDMSLICFCIVFNKSFIHKYLHFKLFILL